MSGDASGPTGPIVPVILSGGSGTRLWPLSRAMFPKQFIKRLDSEDTCLLGAALRRLDRKHGFAAPIVLTNADYRFLVEQEVTEAGLSDAQIVLEPMQRNTAPAIAVAAILALKQDAEAILVVMPSDHVIRNSEGFVAAVWSAAKVAASGRYVLFGIKPTSPHTGYGYIHQGGVLPGVDGVFKVDAFLEKPSAAKACAYVADGSYAWNSGIFVIHAAKFLEDLSRLMPDVAQAARGAVEGARGDLGFLRLDAAAFARSPNISVDYAVMEKTDLATVMPFDIGWSDVGSWSALWEISEHDDQENYVNGEAVLDDTSGCFVHTDRKLVATIGARDLIIVNTPDALLVADRSRAQDVGKFVAKLKAAGRREQEQHLRNFRPWGFFETLNLNGRFQVKRLNVKPGGKLSMQMHHHRSEHWIVVHGTAKVTVGSTEKLVRENESVYISATEWHRLENPGKVPLDLIEVQIGTYLGEDDIVRGDDMYNRTQKETK